MDFYSWFIVLTFLFAAGALIGWGIEFLFRNLISHRGPKGYFFINPGFCTGPYLPIYGIGLSVMFVLSYLFSEKMDKIWVIVMIAVTMTVIEFIGGIYLLKFHNMRLWDYRNRWGNIMGVVCPLFSLIWGLIGAAYYLFLHPVMIDWLIWLSKNLAFCFFVGLFYGFFLIDLFSSLQKASIIRRYGNEKDVVVKYEELKELVLKKEKEAEATSKNPFFKQIPNPENLLEALDKHTESLESKLTAAKSKRKKHHS